MTSLRLVLLAATFGMAGLVFVLLNDLESTDSEYYHQVTSPKTLERFGVPVKDLHVFVVKSRNHFRSGFMETGFATTAVTIDAPGHGAANISRLEYKNIPDAMYSKFRVAE